MKENTKVKSENFISIQGWMVSELGLKGNELLIYAIIYGFSQDGESRFTGSLRYLCDWTNSTKTGVSKCLQSLVLNGYLVKTDIIKSGVKFCEYHTTKVMGGCNKVTHPIQQSNTGGMQQSGHNNIDLDNIEENIKNKIVLEKQKIFKNWSLEDFKSDIKKHRGAAELSMTELESFYDYWREINPGGKMRFQLEKTWETDLRLKTWARRAFSKVGGATHQDKQKNALDDAAMSLMNRYMNGQ